MTRSIGTSIRAILDRAVRAGARFTRAPRRMLFAIAGAGVVGLVLYGCDRSEQHIVGELERLSRGEGPGEFFARFDYVCFDYSSAVPKAEFTEAAAKRNIPVKVSWAACGVDRSCCSLNSDVAGVVGLVKDNTIRCVEMNRAFLADPPRAICAKPSELVVKKQTFTTAAQIPYRSVRSVPGKTYYAIGEKQ